MHVPSLVAGILALLAVATLTPVLLAPADAIAATWLLAISPLHIFFSRLARPYGILVLCGGTGLACFFLWWHTGLRRYRDVFVVCAIVGTYAHLSCAPLFAATAAYVVLSYVRGRRSARVSLREIASTFLAMGVVLGVLLLPALTRNSAGIGRLGASTVTPATLWGGAQLILGTSQPVLLAAMVGLLCLMITWALCERDRSSYVRFLAFCCVVQVGVVALCRPIAVDVPIVWARYCSVALVPLLTILATGVSSVDRSVRRAVGWWPPHGVSLGAILLLVAMGPLRTIYYYPNNFTNHASLEADYDPHGYFERFRPVTIPPFYDTLRASRPGSLLLVEAPWHYYWQSYAYYQRIHRQQVIIGGIDRHLREVRIGEVPLDARFEGFQRIVNVGDYAMLARRRVDYVVFHKALEYETLMPFADTETATAVNEWIAEYSFLFGPPVYDDRVIAVFDVRRSTLPSATRPGIDTAEPR
jgi:hypothetical protein